MWNVFQSVVPYAQQVVLTHQLQREPTLGEITFMQPIHSIRVVLINQLTHQLQREPTLEEIKFMLGKGSISAQVYQVKDLESN